MFSFTQQEKAVLVFLAASIFFGSFFLLLKKGHPELAEVFYLPIKQIIQKKVYINSATQEEWESLPAIGEYRASAIIAERKKRGRFQTTEDVRYVKGIGPYVFNQIKPYLRED